MNKADQQLQHLRQEGRLVASGSLALDPEKAREKLSKYQLEDPHHYVLELVKAAHLLGATKIEIEQDADELEMRFDGQPLQERQLEAIVSYAFQRSETPQSMALRHLAVAFQSAQALAPREMWLQVDAGADCWRVHIDRELRVEIEARLEPSSQSYRFYLRERFRISHLGEFFRARKGQLAEQLVLRERCRFAHIPISINGADDLREDLSEDGREELGLWFTARGERIQMYPSAAEDVGRVHLLQHGVLIETLELEALPGRVEVLVDSPRLQLDLSRRQIVRDEAWEALREDIMEHCYRMRSGRLRRQWYGRRVRKLPALFHQALADYVRRPPTEDRPRTELVKLLARFEDAKVFRLASEQVDDTWQSIEQIREDCQRRGELRYTLSLYDLEPSRCEGAIYSEAGVDPQALATYLGYPAVNLGPALIRKELGRGKGNPRFEHDHAPQGWPFEVPHETQEKIRIANRTKARHLAAQRRAFRFDDDPRRHNRPQGPSRQHRHTRRRRNKKR